MQFSPKKDKKAKTVSYILMAAAIVVLVFSVTLQFSYHVILDISAVFLFIYGFEVYLRYAVTAFTYMTDGENFIITKVTGKKQETVCNLAMKTAIEIRPYEKGDGGSKEIEKKYGKIGYRYNYVQSMNRKNAYTIYFSFNDSVAEIIFEPNDALVLRITEDMEFCKKAENESF